MVAVRLLFGLLILPNLLFAQATEGLRQLNGTKLYVKVIGKGEPLLIVHGGPGMNHTYFLPHLNTLAKSYQVILYDQRASGRSALPPTDSISLLSFAQDIEALRKEFKIDKLTLLGHSWGAIPAVDYAIRYPENVKGLILCNAVPLNKTFDEEMANTQRIKMTGRDSTDRSILLGSPNFKAGKASAYKKVLLLSFRNSFYDDSNFQKLDFTLPDNYKEASAALYAGLGSDLANYDYYESIKQFTFPVLLMHGEADAIPLRATEQARDNLPHSSLEIFAHSGHFIFIEENRKFNATVKRFMEGK